VLLKYAQGKFILYMVSRRKQWKELEIVFVRGFRQDSCNVCQRALKNTCAGSLSSRRLSEKHINKNVRFRDFSFQKRL